ncbi:MAG: hypothetical protein LBB73_01830 [Dysgonamonadaceae bacterium]|jgi:hypothetical protein|nr:hypothetical protein [Dysgonamonadaceae bacterium]
MKNYIKTYLHAINDKLKNNNTSEHFFRSPLETLLKETTGYSVINEARQIDCGKPDLTLLKNNIPVAFVETKDIDKNISKPNKSEKKQFERYKNDLDNLIITNYLKFQLFNGTPARERS